MSSVPEASSGNGSAAPSCTSSILLHRLSPGKRAGFASRPGLQRWSQWMQSWRRDANIDIRTWYDDDLPRIFQSAVPQLAAKLMSFHEKIERVDAAYAARTAIISTPQSLAAEHGGRIESCTPQSLRAALQARRRVRRSRRFARLASKASPGCVLCARHSSL